jgi:SAM-dependent methyltransferase
MPPGWLRQGTIWETDLIAATLPAATYDLIFARWVFLFLPDPEAHLRKRVAALKPGGVLAIEDYCGATMRRVPEPPQWENFLKADLAFFASQGGDANIGARLPDLLRARRPHRRGRQAHDQVRSRRVSRLELGIELLHGRDTAAREVSTV